MSIKLKDLGSAIAGYELEIYDVVGTELRCTRLGHDKPVRNFIDLVYITDDYTISSIQPNPNHENCMNVFLKEEIK